MWRVFGLSGASCGGCLVSLERHVEDVWAVWSVMWRMFGLSGALCGGCLVCLERHVEDV